MRPSGGNRNDACTMVGLSGEYKEGENVAIREMPTIWPQ